jgi:hypothetical protein
VKRKSTKAKRHGRPCLPGYKDEPDIAREFGVTRDTWRKRRLKAKRTGKPLVPPYIEVARSFLYPDAGKVAWLKSQEQQPAPSRRTAIA